MYGLMILSWFCCDYSITVTSLKRCNGLGVAMYHVCILDSNVPRSSMSIPHGLLLSTPPSSSPFRRSSIFTCLLVCFYNKYRSSHSQVNVGFLLIFFPLQERIFPHPNNVTVDEADNLWTRGNERGLRTRGMDGSWNLTCKISAKL